MNYIEPLPAMSSADFEKNIISIYKGLDAWLDMKGKEMSYPPQQAALEKIVENAKTAERYKARNEMTDYEKGCYDTIMYYAERAQAALDEEVY